MMTPKEDEPRAKMDSVVASMLAEMLDLMLIERDVLIAILRSKERLLI